MALQTALPEGNPQPNKPTLIGGTVMLFGIPIGLILVAIFIHWFFALALAGFLAWGAMKGVKDQQKKENKKPRNGNQDTADRSEVNYWRAREARANALSAEFRCKQAIANNQKQATPLTTKERIKQHLN